MKTTKAQVHMLPTEDSILGQLIKCIDGGTPKTKVGEFAINLVPRATSERVKWEHYHLYITTDEEIKEGDWYYYNHNGGIIAQRNGILGEVDGKVIASTDSELTGI